MRNLIDIIAHASQDSKGDVRDLDAARAILTHMSPMQRYKLIDKLPYLRDWDSRYRQAVEYIAQNMDEFNSHVQDDERPLDDGGIHRLY